MNPLASALAAELLAAGLFVSAYVFTTRLIPRASTLLRGVAVIVCAAWIASAAFHVLSAFRAFNVFVALFVFGISGLCAWRTGAESGARDRDLRFLGKMRRALVRSRYRHVVLAFSLFASIVALHSLLLPPLGWDSLTYHAVKAAMWVQSGGLVDVDAPGTWALYRNFWGGAEVLTAWAMLPFHSDTLAMGVQAACWAALGLALIALARELGAREPYASSIAGLVLATPTIRMQAGTGYVEMVALLFLTSGMALATRFLRRPERGLLVLAAAALGLAAGVKFPYAPMSALVLAVILPRAITGNGSLRLRLLWLPAALAIFAAGIAPWLWNAYATSGAPLSPMPLELLGIEIGRANVETAAYLARPLPATTAASEIDQLLYALLRGYENPGTPTVLAATLGLLSTPWLVARGNRGMLLLLPVLLTSVFEYQSHGLSIVRHYWPGSSVRFLLVPLVLGAVISVIPFRRDDGPGRFYLWFLWIGVFLAFALYLATAISPRCAAGIAGLLLSLCVLRLAVAALTGRVGSRPVRLAACAAAASVFVLIAHGIHDGTRTELARVGFVKAPVAPYWFGASLRVDEPSLPRRIAMTSGPWVRGDNWFVYPFLGRRLQNEALYVPISGDGLIRHLGSPAANEEHVRTADFPKWLGRLRAEHVTEVMSFSPPSIELAWMESHPELFRRLDGGAGDWGLFAVAR